MTSLPALCVLRTLREPDGTIVCRAGRTREGHAALVGELTGRAVAILFASDGSLLEVRLEERGFSFPVGRVTFRTLRPLSFQEFLQALGKDVLARSLRAGAVPGAEITPSLHLQTLGLLRARSARPRCLASPCGSCPACDQGEGASLPPAQVF